MKLSELRKCDSCKGILAPRGQFYVVRVSLAIASPKAYNQVMGLAAIFGGALGLAEAMSPDEHVIKIAGDEDKNLLDEMLICQECYMMRDLNLAQLAEALHSEKERS